MNTSEQRAYELLKWQSLGPLQKFDSSYPYLKTWKLYSDRALDATDKQDPYESSSELAAFRELERKGVFNQSDFYSPSKAADGYYTKRLKQLSAGNAESASSAGRTCKPSDPERAREAPSLADAQQSRRAEMRSRRQRL